ncbi:MAG: dTMP kinase [Gammaproteobacteria bacterium]|nr:dTMP kinase [Gammaproteobacteria bacterium]MBU1482119.1 dTMP kinase [Gammaproteobacteria bacterium]
MRSAKFITFEGVDGAGKSTHLEWFADTLRKRGIDLLVTREPGGTLLGERLREILLNQPMHAETEAMLMFAARREHVEQVIRPALQCGTWVISDRFSDASFAYQGGGRGVPLAKLEQLEQWVHGDLQPHLTLLFDIPIEIARQRLSNNVSLDRFEQERGEFFERVRQAYLARVARNPQRFAVIHAEKTLPEVQKALAKIVATL